MKELPSGGPAAPGAGSLRVRQVVVLTTAMLTFIPFWKAGAVVLCDFGSSAFYAGGIAMQAFGPAFPWYILAVMIFSGAMLAVYTESSSMFVRGGVYRVVKEAMGGSMAKISVSALMFDYVVTGPISAISAGHYLSGLLSSALPLAGIDWHINSNLTAVVFALTVTVYFWRENIKGIEESSDSSAKIVGYISVVGAILLVWSGVTVWQRGLTLPGFELSFNEESLGWAAKIDWLKPIGMMGIIMAFGHSVLAMSGIETLAQVYREMEFPKIKNLKKTAFLVFAFSLIFTGLLTFMAAVIISPEILKEKYADNLLSGLAMGLSGPLWARLLLQTFVVVGGVVMLAGAVNTAIVGSNGVLNRVAEDGVLTDWFRHLHPKYGTTHRIVNLIAVIQISIIILCMGDIYLLGEAYAFGVLWSFVFKTIALSMLRFKDHSKREWMVPLNVKIRETYFPAGIMLILVVLLSTAGMNLVTKKVATVSGMLFTAAFYTIFYFSERLNVRRRSGIPNGHEEKLNSRNEIDVSSALSELSKPNRILVPVRNPENLYHLNKILETADDSDTDIIVMHSKVAKGIHLEGESSNMGPEEKNLFTKIVAVAEKHGQTITPLLVLSNDPFYAMAQVARTSGADQIVMGVSGVSGADMQLERLVMAWGALKAGSAPEKQALARVVWEGRELSYQLS